MFALVTSALGLSITVVGAQGHLGRELVAQSLQRQWTVCGLVRRPQEPILYPTRRGWLSPTNDYMATPMPQLDRLVLTSEVADCADTDAIVIAASARPFAPRTEVQGQVDAVRELCARATPDTCICLVSAHGAGDSLEGADAGIQFMHAAYLREAYSAKEEQERLVRESGARVRILRPRVLSFAPIPFNPISTTREDLARDILSWVSQTC